MFARKHIVDGVVRITDIGTGPRAAALWPDDERIEVDRMPVGFGPFVPDPQNPRQAIPDPAEPARKAAAAKLEAAVAAETRLLVLERLADKGEPGAAAKLAEEVAKIEAAKIEAPKG